MIVTVRSLRGSPGATTAALGLAACLERGVYVEGDCDGGAVAARLGLHREPGVTTLAADPGVTGLEQHAQHTSGGLLVLPGPEDPDRASLLWERAGDALAGTFMSADASIVVDLGRGGRRSASHRAMRRVSALELIVVRPTVDELVAAASVIGNAETDPPTRLVLVGGNHRQSGAPLPVWGAIADDPGAAQALITGGSVHRFARSALARSLADLADRVATLGSLSAEVPA